MLYHQISAVLEPKNFKRRIIGFDTFSGFPRKSDFDPKETEIGQANNSISLTRMKEWISIRSHDRLVQSGEQIELVIGDAVDTIPKFVKNNLQLGIAMLVLDFDLYEPTKVALEYFLPRMPKVRLLCLMSYSTQDGLEKLRLSSKR